MARRNPLTDAILDIKHDFDALREESRKGRAIPIGMEKVGKREFMERWKKMGREERARLLDDPKQRKAIIEMIRGTQ